MVDLWVIQRKVNRKQNSWVTLKIIITIYKLQAPCKAQNLPRLEDSKSNFLLKENGWFDITYVKQFAWVAWHTLVLDWENCAIPINVTRNISGRYHFWGEDWRVNVSSQSAKSVELIPPPVMNVADSKYCQHCSYKQAGGGGLAGSSRKRKTGHTVAARNAKSDTSQKILERSKVEKQSNIEFDLWNPRIHSEWTGDTSSHATPQQKVPKSTSLVQLMQFLGEVTICDGDHTLWPCEVESILGDKNIDLKL